MSKEWAWSYSKYKNYDTCPKRHYEIDLAHNFTESSDQLIWGNEVHNALAHACTGKAPLPDSMKDYQPWVTEMQTGVFANVNEPWAKWLSAPGSSLDVELKLAITKDFQPTQWFANNVWFRGICDGIRFDPTRTVALARDWKTGKILHDSRQLFLMTQCLFAHYPTLKRVRTEFVWLKDDCTTPETFDRATMARQWPPILAQVQQMHHAAVTMTYPPKPGKLCARYCPVVSCPYHGKRH